MPGCFLHVVIVNLNMVFFTVYHTLRRYCMASVYTDGGEGVENNAVLAVEWWIKVGRCRGDNVSHIDIQANIIEDVISHIDITYPISIRWMTI